MRADSGFDSKNSRFIGVLNGYVQIFIGIMEEIFLIPKVALVCIHGGEASASSARIYNGAIHIIVQIYYLVGHLPYR